MNRVDNQQRDGLVLSSEYRVVFSSAYRVPSVNLFLGTLHSVLGTLHWCFYA
jgi:hypothetical protein